jgi:hypothetical protein
MAHACNPSYLGGRHQEDHDSKPAQANNSLDPTSKNTHHKKRTDITNPSTTKKIVLKSLFHSRLAGCTLCIVSCDLVLRSAVGFLDTGHPVNSEFQINNGFFIVLFL